MNQPRKHKFLRWCAKSCLFFLGGGLLGTHENQEKMFLNQFGYIEQSHNPCFYLKTGTKRSICCCWKSKNCTQTGYILFITD